MSGEPEYGVTIKQVPEQKVSSLRKRIPIRRLGRLFMELLRSLKGWPAGPAQAIYYDAGFDPTSVDVEVAFPVAEGGEKTIPGGEMACVTHVGEYSMLGSAYEALMTWMKREGLAAAGPRREVYLVGPGSGKDPEEYVTEIQVPVSVANR
ncbi:MAG: GyrI-like domain-containing protein [Ignavibacteriales bacterium]